MNWVHRVSLFCLVFSLPLRADFDTDDLPANLAERAQAFLEADTTTARQSMVRFSDEELESITTTFKKSHNKKEQRLFWLIEELYRRHAERTAAERIRYLYLAVLGALGIILAYSILAFRQSRRHGNLPLRAQDTPAPLRSEKNPPTPPARRKGGRKKVRTK